jgi:glutathione S-transferase
LKYKTEWVEYPDIETVCKKIGAPPTDKKADGRDYYTLPVIYDPSTKAVVADSPVIVKYLDNTYPDTSRLFPEGTQAFQRVFHHLVIPTVITPGLHIVLYRVWKLLNPPSQAYFRQTREVLFGQNLEDIGGEEYWKNLENGLVRLKECLELNGEGKDMLFAGDRITYADFQLASAFVWIRVVCGKESEDWKRLSSIHGGKWSKFLQQFEKYEYVDV